MSKTPDTITAIIDQIGRGLRGGLVYVGAHNLTHRCDEQHGEWRSGFRAEFDTTRQNIRFDVGLQFAVNGKKREDWQITVSYEPDDTYAVFLTRKVKTGREVITEQHDVYCDELQSVVEKFYDDAIKKFNNGSIDFS